MVLYFMMYRCRWNGCVSLIFKFGIYGFRDGFHGNNDDVWGKRRRKMFVMWYFLCIVYDIKTDFIILTSLTPTLYVNPFWIFFAR